MSAWKLSTIFTTLLLVTSSAAFAQDEEIKWYDQITISGGITAAIQGTSGNDDPTASTKDDTDYSFTFDLGIESEIAPNQNIIVAIESGDGDGVNNNFDTNTSPNYDPYNTFNAQQDVTISQAYYEGTFYDGMLTVSAGKMDIHSLTDENNVAGDETSQFMAGIFCRLAGTLFAELDNYYAPGVRILLIPNEMLELTWVGANSSNENVGTRGYNAVQANLKPNLGGMEGNYRVYFIRDARVYTKIVGGGTESNNAWGLSFDQMFNENIGLFFRYGSQDDQLSENAINSAMAAGFTVAGSYWNRPDDLFGIGYGVTERNNGIATAYTGDQKIFEAFYRYQILERMSLTPDFQVHSDLPRTTKRSVTVLGVRAQLDF